MPSVGTDCTLNSTIQPNFAVDAGSFSRTSDPRMTITRLPIASSNNPFRRNASEIIGFRAPLSSTPSAARTTAVFHNLLQSFRHRTIRSRYTHNNPAEIVVIIIGSGLSNTNRDIKVTTPSMKKVVTKIPTYRIVRHCNAPALPSMRASVAHPLQFHEMSLHTPEARSTFNAVIM
jgi:hypothetical protein